MQNRPQISIPSVTPATPKTPVESGKQGVKFSSFSPPQISTPQVMPKKRGRPPGSKNKDTDSAKKRKLETGAAKETNTNISKSSSIKNLPPNLNNSPNTGPSNVTNNTSRKEDSLDDVDVTEADFERIISLPQMQPSDDEEDEESENGEDEKNEDVHSENEQEKNDPQQEAEDEEERKMLEQRDKEDEDKQIKEYGEKMKILLSKFTKEQLDRYEYYRRSAFPKAVMKRLIKQIAGSPVSNETSIVISGITKIFVGELVETAREVMKEWREKGPLRPVHIREAYRRLKEKDPILSSSKYTKQLFFRR